MSLRGKDVTIDRRDLLKVSAATAGALALPGDLAAQGAPRKGGTLRISMPYNPAALDPMTGRNAPDFNALYAIFDTLIDYEPMTLALRPGLAKSWKFTDPKTLVLDLATGVKFHDGSDFDAEAVKFNIERYKTDARSNVKADVASIEKVEVANPSQIVFHLNRANAGLPLILTNRAGCMVSPKSVKEKGPNVDRHPVGTGPFKFVDWQDNSAIKLVRNENYWKPGLPHLDGIDIRIVNELNTAVRTAIAGEADVVLNMQPQQKVLADRANNLTVIVGPSLTFYGAFLNYARPPLDDVRIRQAMNYAINRDEINKVATLGLGEASCAVLPKQHWAQDPATAHYYNFDLAKAKKLLADAGHPDGIDIEGWGWSDQVAMQRQELITTQLAKAGIRVKLALVAPGPAMSSFLIEKKGAMLISPSGGYPDPTQFYEALFNKDALRNAGKIELPGYRELVDQTMEAQDQAARKAVFAKLQRFVIENAMQLPYFIAPNILIFTKKVQNLKGDLPGAPKFTEVWLQA
jgi:peptide/nickel transport system substrate-binding protein/glutathione transport system substrate-binding protein